MRLVSVRSQTLQRVLLYLSIQTIALLESTSVLIGGAGYAWHWEHLLLAPAALQYVWWYTLAGYPSIIAWLFVIAVRVVRRKEFADQPWSRQKRRLCLWIATALLVADTIAFVANRHWQPEAWTHVYLMLLALPLLMLPVRLAKKTTAVGVSANPGVP